jgi:effector-binding domain-containing protein
MRYAVQVMHMSATPIAVVKRRAPLDQMARVVPEACGTVWRAMKGLGITGLGRHVAVYRAETGGALDVEVGVEVAAPFGGNGDVVDSATPAGEVATVTHFGPYGGLAAAHRAVREWCDANGRAPAGVSWEVYGHWLPEWDADPSKIRTDVFYVLAPPGHRA